MDAKQLAGKLEAVGEFNLSTAETIIQDLDAVSDLSLAILQEGHQPTAEELENIANAVLATLNWVRVVHQGVDVEGHSAPTPELLQAMAVLTRSQAELVDHLYAGIACDVVESIAAGMPVFSDDRFAEETPVGGVA